jgi:hypothetical protein
LNPDWVDFLVHKPIQVIMANQYTLTGMDNLCTVFGRVDPAFRTRFSCTPTAFNSYAVKPIQGQFLTDLITATQTHPWSISYSPVYQARIAGLSVANLYNGAGNLIIPTQLSASLPALEVGTQQSQSAVDLTTATGPFVAPFAHFMYIQVSRSYVRASCEERSELVEFLVWLYESQVMHQIGALQASPIIHPRIQTDLGVTRLRSEMTCVENIPVAENAAVKTMRYLGFETVEQPIQQMMNLYTFATESTYLFT